MKLLVHNKTRGFITYSVLKDVLRVQPQKYGGEKIKNRSKNKKGVLPLARRVEHFSVLCILKNDGITINLLIHVY